jgi:Zn-dependent oligopeptidase
MRYRRSILEAAAARDAMASLQEFLGRPPSNEAFLQQKGLK